MIVRTESLFGKDSSCSALSTEHTHTHNFAMSTCGTKSCLWVRGHFVLPLRSSHKIEETKGKQPPEGVPSLRNAMFPLFPCLLVPLLADWSYSGQGDSLSPRVCGPSGIHSFYGLGKEGWLV